MGSIRRAQSAALSNDACFQVIAKEWTRHQGYIDAAAANQQTGQRIVNDMRTLLLRLGSMQSTELAHIRTKLLVLAYFVEDGVWNLESDLAKSIAEDLDRLADRLVIDESGSLRKPKARGAKKAHGKARRAYDPERSSAVS